MQKIVIKVGTSTISKKCLKGTYPFINNLVDTICKLENAGHDIVLVSSGAIDFGVTKLSLAKRPDDILGLQAAAAVGQPLLMNEYIKSFDRHKKIVGQILLTKEGIIIDEYRQNSRNALFAAFEYGVVPIINENDILATDELKLGDNDRLSAYVAGLIDADLLILLTDADGLFDKHPDKPGAKLINHVTKITKEITQSVLDASSRVGTGGMITKIMAAEIAADYGIKTLIMNGKDPSLIFDAIAGKPVGTLFDIK